MKLAIKIKQISYGPVFLCIDFFVYLNFFVKCSRKMNTGKKNYEFWKKKMLYFFFYF